MEKLAIYLNDHLGGATGGVELARRIAGNNEGNDYGDVVARLADEIDEDRETLKRLMDRLDVDPKAYKVIGGWLSEKLSRLKLNGELLEYSPLSRLIELEGMSLGVRGKRALWVALQASLGGDPRLAEFDFDALIARADEQFAQLEELRRRSAQEAFAGDGG